jgi:WXG100 family type VII secretion target
MSSTTSINTDQVRSVANQFRQKSQDSASMVQQLKSAVNSMEWQGMAAERFYSDYTQWNQQMQKHVELLNGIGSELDKIAQAYDAITQQLTHM